MKRVRAYNGSKMMTKTFKIFLYTGYLFVIVLDIYQGFYSPISRLTIIGSYISNIFLIIVLFLLTLNNYKKLEKEMKEQDEMLSKKLDDLKRDFPHRCEWKCDICHQSRIDALIGIVKYKTTGEYLEFNIKHCKDDPLCILKATNIDTWKGIKVYKI